MCWKNGGRNWTNRIPRRSSWIDSCPTNQLSRRQKAEWNKRNGGQPRGISLFLCSFSITLDSCLPPLLRSSCSIQWLAALIFSESFNPKRQGTQLNYPHFIGAVAATTDVAVNPKSLRIAPPRRHTVRARKRENSKSDTQTTGRSAAGPTSASDHRRK